MPSASGSIIIDESESVIVKKIFDLYLSGYSILAIKRELEKECIPSPTGKNCWPKRTIDTILSNEKYTGCVVFGKTFTDLVYSDPGKNVFRKSFSKGQQDKYQSETNHTSIISKELFDEVQKEKTRRSNILQNDDGTVSWKSSHYSMKYKLQD